MTATAKAKDKGAARGTGVMWLPNRATPGAVSSMPPRDRAVATTAGMGRQISLAPGVMAGVAASSATMGLVNMSGTCGTRAAMGVARDAASPADARAGTGAARDAPSAAETRVATGAARDASSPGASRAVTGVARDAVAVAAIGSAPRETEMASE